jgi:hypothetical protein
MISAENAIRTFRRDLAITSVLKGLLLGGLVVLGLMTSALASSWMVLVLGLGMTVGWIVLSHRSARGSYLAADSPLLIASGQYEEAEQQLEELIKTFWLFRSVKLMGLHHLAVLRHAQRKWRESAMLSQALLGQRLKGMQGIARSTQLMLADSLLELGDLPGVYAVLSDLYSQKLSLMEAMNLLMVQLDYETRIGAWPAMFQNIAQKTQLAELMPVNSAARTQAMLALAAKRVGRPDWTDWLCRRAELLIDINELTVQRPILNELLLKTDQS